MANLDVTRIKLPPWQPDNVKFWFKMVDGLFELYNNCDPPPSGKTKVMLLQSTLPMELLCQHEAAIDTTDPYQAMKDAICGSTHKSDIALYEEAIALKLGSLPLEYFRKLIATLNEVRANDKPLTTKSQCWGWLVKMMLER